MVVDCFAEPPERTEFPRFLDPHTYVDLYAPVWCDPAQGVLVEAVDADGEVTASCSTVDGVCILRGPQSSQPVLIRQSEQSLGVLADAGAHLDTRHLQGDMPYLIINRTDQPANATPVSAYDEEPAGDLAYAIRIGTHWDIWSYSFETRQNHRLTSDPESDQWAPAYSHDGARLAYLSDEVDGSNQVWVMDPDGSGKRQLSHWHGAESILFVAWSPDDSQLIVTLSGDRNRLVLMPADGGELAEFVPPTSSFATTGNTNALIYATNDATLGAILCVTRFDEPACHGYLAGDAPNLTQDGSFAVAQLGDFGNRRIGTYALGDAVGAFPSIPQLADDSNPVWVTREPSWLAFVSASASGDTVQLYRIGEDHTTRVEIVPHDQVWYLAKRFTERSDRTQ